MRLKLVIELSGNELLAILRSVPKDTAKRILVNIHGCGPRIDQSTEDYEKEKDALWIGADEIIAAKKK